MLDNNLNPWLIEVNHLPSFGTDSPLDKDIKDRLMRQVFSVLPVMSDDQAAYNAFHKAESERRLNAHKAAKEKEIQLLKEKPKTGNQLSGKPKNTSLFPPKRDSSIERDSQRSSSQSQLQQPQDRENEESNQDDNQQREDPQEGNEDEQPDQQQQHLYENSLEGMEEEQQQQLENENESMYPQDQHENHQLSSQTATTDDMLEIIDEEVTPERMEEIKEILKDIYEKKSPEKINKIDRLIAKYTGHEEEFLLFVFSKYNISSNEYEKSKPKSIRDAVAARSLGIAGVASSSSSSDHQHTNGKQSPDNATVMTENTKKPGNGNNNNKFDAKRHSRSVSPPRSTGPRRIVPTWKSSISDEDTSLKSEIFTTHIPTEEDEWMKLEVSRLTQFTRIFPPPEPHASSVDSNKFSNDEELFAEKEEQEENEEENEGVATGQSEEKTKKEKEKEKEKETVKVHKTASYEDIIFKVFLEDHRATYRRTRPLPHRAKPEEGSFLPPLDPPPTSRSSFSSMVSYWRYFRVSS
jgi:hypothetical protein